MPKFFLKQNADRCNQTQSISKTVCALHFVKVWSLMRRGPLFSLTPFQFCLRLASVVKIHEYSQGNEKALRKLFSSHYHPPRLTSVLHLHHSFYFAYPSVTPHTTFHLPHFSSPLSFFFNPPSSQSLHEILWLSSEICLHTHIVAVVCGW